MKKPTTLFSKDQIDTIEIAIGKAETESSAEIIPVIASVSGRYDRAEDLFAFFFSLLALATYWVGIHTLSTDGISWDSPSTKLSLGVIICILIVAFSIGIALSSRLSFLRLPFIGKKEMQEEVEQRACECFQKFRIRNTENATGILIYVSLYEHRVRILGDDAIAAKLSPSDWDEVRDRIITGFKMGTPAEGLESGIHHAGKILADSLPIQPEDQNELPNKLILID